MKVAAGDVSGGADRLAPRAGDSGWAVSREAPGKRALVSRGFALAGLRPGARVLDVGCGQGTSVELLRRSHGLRAVGLDLSAAERGGALGHRLRADAHHLPVGDGALDAVLLECVLSLLSDRGAVLRECARALAPAGKLVLMDLYARAARPGAREAPGWGGATLLPGERIQGLVASSGLAVLAWEDHSTVLKECLFRLIMEAPGDGPCPVGGEARSARAAGAVPGYCLLVAGRVASPRGGGEGIA